MLKKDKKQNITESENNKENKSGSVLKAKIGSNLGYALLAIAIVVAFVVVNLIVGQLPLTLDFTPNKMYSISDATDQMLNEMAEDVEIIALYDRVQGMANPNIADVIRILDDYDKYEHVSVSYISLNDNPGIVNKKVGNATAAAYSEGDYIVKSDKRTKRIAYTDVFEFQMNYTTYTNEIVANVAEKEFTNAIKYVTTTEIPKVYVSTGFLENDKSLYGYIFEDLDNMNIDVEDINIAKTEIPEDADALIFLAPKKDLDNTSYIKLQSWLDLGGKAIFAFDADNTKVKFNNFNKILRDMYGMEINNDIVSDDEKYQIATADDKYIIYGAETLKNGPISSETGNSLEQAYIANESRSIKKINATGTFDYYPLIQTSSNGVSFDYETNSELQHVQTLVACGEWKRDALNISRVVVFGSSKQLMNENIANYNDQTSEYLFLYSIDWMIGEGAMESVKGVESRTDITDKVIVDVTQSRWLFVFCVIVYPFAIIGAGIFVWVKRRHL